MADERRDVKAVPRTTIPTATLEGLVEDNALFEKYAKVVEDPSVVLFRAEMGVVWATDLVGEQANWVGYSVRVESKDRIILQSGPRKDWRNILDKALTLWIEGSDTVVDPL